MEWEAISKDPDYQALPIATKKKVAQGWFAETVSPDPDFQALPVERRDWTYSNFLMDSGIIPKIEKADPAKAIIQQQIGGKVPAGYRYNEMGELQPIESKATTKGIIEALHEPTAEPKGIGDYVARVIPESIQKTAYGVARMPYDLAKGITDPLAKGFQRAVSGEQDTPENVGQVFTELGQNAAGVVTGLSEFMGKPIGLYGWEEMKKAWLTDPAGSALGIAPMAKGVVSYAKARGITPKEAIPQIFEEAKEANVPVKDILYQPPEGIIRSNIPLKGGRVTGAPIERLAGRGEPEVLYSKGGPEIVQRARAQEPTVTKPTVPIGEGPPEGIVRQNVPAKGSVVEGEPIVPLVNREAEMGNFFRGTIPETTYASKPTPPAESGPMPLIRRDEGFQRGTVNLESGGLQTIYEKLFAQPDPPKFAKPGTPEAAIETIHQANREGGRNRDKISFEKAKSVFFKNITGTDANVVRQIEKIGGPEAQRLVRAKVLQRGSDAQAKILVDQNNEIFKGMSGQEYQLLNDYRESKRVVEIQDYKPKHMTTGGKTAAEHQAWLDIIPPETKKRLDAVNGKVQEAYKSNLDALLENGLIDQEGYKTLAGYADYNPQRFLEHLDPVQKTGASGKINVHDSGIKKLKEGSEGLLFSDSRFLLNEATARVQARIAKNNTNKALWDTIEANPQNGIFEKAKVAKYTQDGKPIFQEAPAGYEKISVMLDGKENQMLIPESLAKEWVKNNPLINQTYANLLSWGLGSKILKASATGMNPAFALPNMLRDMVMIWSADAGKNYSPHSPVAMAQMAKDLKTVAGDVIHKKGRYLDYIKEGGGMETLTQYGKIEGPLKQVSEVLGWVGNTSEFMTRLAYRERVLRNLEKQGLDITKPEVRQQATYAARNYLDFAQGGDLVKFLDIGIPYLNAGTQATKSMMNAAKKDPKLFAYKMAQIGAISAMVYTAGRAINPKAIDETDDRTKSNYWVIPLPESFSYMDKNGQMIHSTVKIAKEQSVRPIASMFEAGMEKLFTDKTPTQPTLNAIKDVFNIIPVGKLPPILQAWMGYAANKDFYTNADIWKGDENVKNEERWDYQDNPFWKMVGKTGLDPQKTRYALSQVFTGNNPVVGIMGSAYDAAFGDLPTDIKQKATMDLISSNSIMRRVVGRTNPYVPHAVDVKASKEPEATERYVLNRELGKLTSDYLKDNTEANKQKIVDYISKQDEHEQKRMTDRVLDEVEIHAMPDRSWWKHVSNIQIPEARARAFYARWSKADDEEKERLKETAENLKGFLTDRVIDKILELKRSEK